MAGFVYYDLALLAVFTLAVVFFLSKKRANLQRQGILYLYKTKLGIDYIDRYAKKYEKILIPVQYISIACGYILMVSISWLILKSTYLYLATPISQIIRAPPVAPIIPYFPKIFGVESFFPPLYFTYFIIALAVVAISHEFAHGVFMRLNKIKIHSTGFAFLGPILGAFVEQDEKEMNKSPKFAQLSVLAAGTFANVLMTVLFGIILFIFFTALFVPAGVKFNTYALEKISLAEIQNITDSVQFPGRLEFNVRNQHYLIERETLQRAQEINAREIVAYIDSPALRQQIQGAILSINGKTVASFEQLSGVIKEYSPGDKVIVETAILEPGKGTVAEIKRYEVELSSAGGRAFLGIGVIPQSNGVIEFIYGKTFKKMKDPFVHYNSKIGDFGWFIYYLLWWLVVINIAVALFNMLPLGILDGGRFFELTIAGITRSQTAGKKAFKIATMIILIILFILMIKWAFGFF